MSSWKTTLVIRMSPIPYWLWKDHAEQLRICTMRRLERSLVKEHLQQQYRPLDTENTRNMRYLPRTVADVECSWSESFRQTTCLVDSWVWDMELPEVFGTQKIKSEFQILDTKLYCWNLVLLNCYYFCALVLPSWNKKACMLYFIL